MKAKILSLFDGMACGMLAMQDAGIEVESYDAYEYDEKSANALKGRPNGFAAQVASHNFPQIKQHGNVFGADFTQYKGIDYLIGGSPCFTKGHYVLTKDGYKDISEIQIGDMVLTHKNRFRPVSAIGKKIAPTIKVTANGMLPVVCTLTHPFYVREKTYDYDAKRRGFIKALYKPKKIEAQNLKPKIDYVGYNNLEFTEKWFPMEQYTSASFSKYLLIDSSPLSSPLPFFNTYIVPTPEIALHLQLIIYKECGIHARIEKVSDDEYKVTSAYSNIFDTENTDAHWEVKNQMWVPITSVSHKAIDETVYNITVEEDHTYTVNNMIVYNCTYWSIAQKNNRETEASGIGWELFQQYARAVKEAQPKFFIYENNKSMSQAIRDSITKEFGFDAICINSALVSAQNRNRLYWVGKRNEDGTYSKVDVKQPEDLGILLKDILEDDTIAFNDKAFAYTTRCQAATPKDTLEKHRHTMVAVPVFGDDSKAGRMVGRRINEDGHRADHNKDIECSQRIEINENPDKTNCLSTVSKDNMIISPVCVAQRGRYKEGNSGETEQHFEVRGEKTNTLTTVQKDNLIAQPIRVGNMPTSKGEISDSQGNRVYSVDGKGITQTANGGGWGAKTGLYAVPVYSVPHGYYPGGVEERDKANTLTAQGSYVYNHMIIQPVSAEGKTMQKAFDGLMEKYGFIPEIFNAYNSKALDYKSPTLTTGSLLTSSCAVLKFVEWRGKEYPVYTVKDGIITIKDKQYPIKLKDGYYIIRKLTLIEAMRLQTVPEWYDFSVLSETQALKCLGNGWTVKVISHLIQATIKENERK